MMPEDILEYFCINPSSLKLEEIYEVRPGEHWKGVIQRMLGEIEYPVKY